MNPARLGWSSGCSSLGDCRTTVGDETSNVPSPAHLLESIHECPAAPALPLDLVVEVQDHLVSVASDLERLQRLLAEAAGTLLSTWSAVSHGLALHAVLPGAVPTATALREAATALERSSPALQFEDLATQLLAHSGQRLRHCADRLALQAFAGDSEDASDEAADAVVSPPPGRPSPVAHNKLDSGSVELF